MIARHSKFAYPRGDFEPYPDVPNRLDCQNWWNLHRHGQMSGLSRRLRSQKTTTIWSAIPIGPSLDDREDFRVADCMVSFNSRPWLAMPHNGYAIDRQGKPPDFVLDVPPINTPVFPDYAERMPGPDEKRPDYARYGVTEYWIFGPTDDGYDGPLLSGERLVDGEYRPIEIEWPDENRCRGYSEALGLYVCREDGDLRWLDPKMDGYVRTLYDEVERANRAEAELHDLRRRLESLEDGE